MAGFPTLERQLLQSVTSWRPHKTPRFSATMVLWIFGLWAAIFAASPVTVTPAMEAQYRSHMKLADSDMAHHFAAEKLLLESRYAVYDAKEWFWRFKPDVRERVRALQAVERQREAELAAVDAKLEKHVSNAKAAVGVWSDMGVEEARRMFWKQYEQGKVFARRQTFYDAIFMMINGRTEEHAAVFILRWLFTTLTNFTVGMAIAAVSFMFNLPSMVMAFQPTLMSGLAFFFTAAVAGVSVVFGYLGLLWGAGAGGAYFVVKAAATAGALEGGAARQQARPAHLRYGDHQHHE